MHSHIDAVLGGIIRSAKFQKSKRPHTPGIQTGPSHLIAGHVGVSSKVNKVLHIRVVQSLNIVLG